MSGGRRDANIDAGAQGELARQCNASLALAMLLVVKRYLRVAYGLSSERVAAFHPGARPDISPLFPLSFYSSCRSWRAGYMGWPSRGRTLGIEEIETCQRLRARED